VSIWSSDTISAFAQEAENEIVTRVNCILKRIALEIQPQTSLYFLPQDVISIRRVTWLGKKLEPKAFRGLLKYPIVDPAGVVGGFANSYANAFFISASDSKPEAGMPYCYFYSGFGENVIKIFPTPVIYLAATTVGLYGSEIGNRCIVEYYTFPDFTTSSLRIPTYVARRMIKAFVLYKCFSMEGPGQDLIGAGRQLKRFNGYVEDFRKINAGVYIARTRTRTPNANTFPTRIARPRLPANFGTKVDD